MHALKVSSKETDKRIGAENYKFEQQLRRLEERTAELEFKIGQHQTLISKKYSE